MVSMEKVVASLDSLCKERARETEKCYENMS
jgi:hypothetical protein